MGIPSYFYQIVKNHGDRFMGSKKRVKRLFLDLNCCIHGCKNRIIKSLEGVICPDFEDLVIKEVIRTIIRFGKEVNPEDLLWIAVDGVVPLAKMKQQRERRLNAVHTRETVRHIRETHGQETRDDWDSNAITPGTPFMIKLCDTILDKLSFIQSEINVPFIEMNDVRNSGEGEQKIFKYMRDNINDSPETEDVIYGLDADLIILSILQTPRQSATISLLREKQEFGRLVQDDNGDDELIRFRVSEFADLIPMEWGGPKGANLLKDYVVLMSLMGNDFVPHTPSLTFRSEGVERIVDAYRGVDKRIVSDDDVINWENLAEIFQRLEVHEVDILKNDEDVTLKIRGRILAGQVPFRHAIVSDPVEQEILALDWEHLRHNHTIQVGEKGWANRYYRRLLGDKGVWSNQKMVVSVLTSEYLKSIQWCWDYYCGKDVAGDWYYRFVSGPLLRDLVSPTPTPTLHCDDGREGGVSMYDIPASAQLICVLPPVSHHCLESGARAIANECVDLYPETHDKWAYGKRHAWEQESFLPPIPIKRIMKYIQ